MKRVRTFAMCVGLVGGLAAAVVADTTERPTTLADRTRVNLTIYNGSVSLVHDRRRVSLDAGANRIAWRDVSANMDATSAIVEDPMHPNALRVREQNFNFDLLDPATLLAKYVGRDVEVIHDRPRAGQPERETARVLANNNGIILRYRDRIETGLVDSHLAFPALPPDLRDRPTLTLDLDAERAGSRELDLAYLTGGLAWHAEYVGVVAPGDDRMDLSGLVTLSNTTGTTFEDAHLQLVAGNVNVAAPPPYVLQNIARGGVARAAVTQENYFEYHLYTLERTTTIANNQTKQVALLSARNVPLKKTLELRGASNYYANKNPDLGENIPVGAYLTFANAGGDLGIPLPGGIVRLYKNDSGGTSQFLGSDRIDHTPRNEDVRLHVGDSFDVTAKKRQTDFRGVGGCTYESTYRIDLANAKTVPQDVLVIEPIPGTWSVLSENLPHEKSSSSTATWMVRVPADGKTSLEYSVRVSPCI